MQKLWLQLARDPVKTTTPRRLQQVKFYPDKGSAEKGLYRHSNIYPHRAKCVPEGEQWKVLMPSIISAHQPDSATPIRALLHAEVQGKLMAEPLIPRGWLIAACTLGEHPLKYQQDRHPALSMPRTDLGDWLGFLCSVRCTAVLWAWAIPG